jgi:hypothetical protein
VREGAAKVPTTFVREGGEGANHFCA